MLHSIAAFITSLLFFTPVFAETGTITQLQLFKATSSPYSAITTVTFGKNLYLQNSWATSTGMTARVFCLTGDSCITSWPTGGGGGGSWPFTTTVSYNAQLTQSTSTLLWLRGSPLSLAASSTFATYASTTQLTNSGTIWFTGLTGPAPLAIDSTGKVYAAASTTATSPLTYSAGSFSIQNATASQAGAETQNEFNYVHSATSTFSAPLVYTGSANAVTCTNASSGVTGCLSSTDWAKFTTAASATTTFSSPLVYTLSTNAVTVQNATASQGGQETQNEFNYVHAATTTFSSPLSYTGSTNAVTCPTCSLAGSGFDFTVAGYGVSTSTTVGFTNGIMAMASSTFTATTTLDAVSITAAHSVSASVSTGGYFNLTNTANDGAGMVIFTNHAASALGRLASFDCNSALFDQNCVNIQSAGTQSVLNISGGSPGLGIVKIAGLSGAQSTNSSAALSVDSSANSYQGQGIFAKCNTGTTTPCLVLRDASSNLMLSVDGNKVTTMILSSTTNATVTGSAWLTNSTTTTFGITGISSALLLAGATGGITGYVPPSGCSNQFLTAITATGGFTCAAVADAAFTGTLGTAHGGTNLDTSASTGIMVVNSGTWSASSTLMTYRGGTGLSTVGTNGQVLGISNGVPAYVSTSSGATLSGGYPGMLAGWSSATTIVATGTPIFASFIATSTTATSTAADGINLTGGCFSMNGSCLGSTVGGNIIGIYATMTPGTTTVSFSGPTGSGPSWASGVLTLPANAAYLVIRAWGGGGGGGAQTSVAGSSGSSTCYATGSIACAGGSILVSANGGVGGGFGAYSSAGTGGTATAGDFTLMGGTGGAASGNSAGNGFGGSAPGIGGQGGLAATTTANGNAGGSPGGGGSGARFINQTASSTASGGGSGGYSEKLVTNIVASAFSIGFGGQGGVGTQNGGAGAAGGIVITVYINGASNGSIASSTPGWIPFYNAYGSNLAATSTIFLNTNQYVGIGTSTPAWTTTIVNALAPQLSLGDGNAADYQWTQRAASNNLFFATSTQLATSTASWLWVNQNGLPTFSDGLSVTTGNISLASSTPWAALSIVSTLNPLVVFATSSAALPVFAINTYGSIQTQAMQPSTTTAQVLDWSQTPPQVEYQIGTGAFTITIINATTTTYWGSRKVIWVCNPTAAAAGALSWGGVEWIGSSPTQTTTAGVCDVYSFDITRATSTSAYKVAGTSGTGFK